MREGKNKVFSFANPKNKGFFVTLGLLLLLGIVYTLVRQGKQPEFNIDDVKILGTSTKDRKNAKMKVINLELQLKNFDAQVDDYQRLDNTFLCGSADIIVNDKIRGHSFSLLENKSYSTVFPVKVSFSNGEDGKLCIKSVNLIAE